MTATDALVAAGLTVAGATFVLWLLWDEVKHWAAQPFDVEVTRGVNDDSLAVGAFIDIVRGATRNLIIHDDGNKMQGRTIYDAPEVIQAVDDQMEKHEELAVMCLFNARDDLAMVDQLSKRYPERFHVRYRRWPWRRPAFDVHYKIADDGAVGHLSHHDWGAEERDFEVRDCLAVNRAERNIQLGKYMRRFKREFRLAKAA